MVESFSFYRHGERVFVYSCDLCLCRCSISCREERQNDVALRFSKIKWCVISGDYSLGHERRRTAFDEKDVFQSRGREKGHAF